MAGILKGSVEHYFYAFLVDTATSRRAKGINIFAALVRFFDSQMTRIASHAGTSPVGTVNSNSIRGWYGSGQHVYGNAYGVWRWDRSDGLKMYIYMDFSDPNITTTPINPSTMVQNPIASTTTTFNIRFAIAYDTSGGNPWKGGTANAGADAKANPVWGTSGGSLICFPRANASSGTYNTSKEAVLGFITSSDTTYHKMHIMMDDDALWIAHDRDYIGGHGEIFYFGPYIPTLGVSVTNPLVWLNITDRQTVGPDWAQAYGSTNTQQYYNGGITTPNITGGVKNTYISSIAYFPDAPFQRNQYSGEYDILPWSLRTNDSNSPSQIGFLGIIDPNMFGCIGNIRSNLLINNRNKIVIGCNNAKAMHFTFPWNPDIEPNSGYSKEGIQF